MFWTIIAFLCVVITKFVTALRLRGLKARLEAMQPHIEELRFNFAKVQEEHEEIKLQAEDKETRLNHLDDVVRNLQLVIDKPSDVGLDAEERAQLMQTVESNS